MILLNYLDGDLGERRITHNVTLNGVDRIMTQVVLGENEGLESALRRFKRQVSKAGILADVRRYRHFETPAEKRKRKAEAVRRKQRFR